MQAVRMVTPVLMFAIVTSSAVYGQAGDLSRNTSSQAEKITDSSRNERSTPRASILPLSPAITRPAAKPESSEKYGTHISRTKAILAQLGYNVGRLDGGMTARFKAAVFQYQKAHNLFASGELDEATLRKLTGGVQ